MSCEVSDHYIAGNDQSIKLHNPNSKRFRVYLNNREISCDSDKACIKLYCNVKEVTISWLGRSEHEVTHNSNCNLIRVYLNNREISSKCDKVLLNSVTMWKKWPFHRWQVQSITLRNSNSNLIRVYLNNREISRISDKARIN